MYKMKNDGWIHDIAKALCCIFLIMTSGGMLYSCSSENEDPVPPVQEGTGNDEKEKYTYVYQLKADNYNMPTVLSLLSMMTLLREKILVVWLMETGQLLSILLIILSLSSGREKNRL